MRNLTLNGNLQMMEDTIIANLPPTALRTILRTLLGVDPKVTPAFRALTSDYLSKSTPSSIPVLFHASSQNPTAEFFEFQKRYRCLMGCGQGFQTLEALREVVQQASECVSGAVGSEDVLAVVDHDIVQATTAVQKQILSATGPRPLSESELMISKKLIAALVSCQENASSLKCEFPFERSKSRVEMLFGSVTNGTKADAVVKSASFKTKDSTLEKTQLGRNIVPRVFMGLWQFSSPAWGTASHSRVTADFRKHVDAGFVSYGK